MEEQFDIVFYGTDRTGDDRLAIVDKVRELLKLDEQQAEQLFDSPSGVVLASTADEDKAKRIVGALVKAGAACNYRHGATTVKRSDWEQWQLEDQVDAVPDNRFRCVACGYTVKLQDDEVPPAICPECDVVQSKYASVDAQKRERERIRNGLLAVKNAQARREQAEIDRLRQEALREQIKKELSKEFDEHRSLQLRTQTVMAAAATFLLGIGGTLGFVMLNSDSGRFAAPPTDVVQNVTTPSTGRTLAIAGNLVTRLGDTPTTAVMPAPATASPATLLPETLPLLSPAPTDVSKIDGIDNAWYAALDNTALVTARLQRLADERLATGQVDAATRAADLVDTPVDRVLLKARIADHGTDDWNTVTTAERRYEIRSDIDRLDNLHDRAMALLALERLDTAGGDGPDTPQALARLFDATSTGTLDRLRAEALIGATRARQGDGARARDWFDAANDTLLEMDSPVDQLAALPVLAQAYFEANDSRSAEKLLALAYRGLASMPPSERRDDIVEETALAFTAMGRSDEAAMLTQRFFTSLLERDLRLARLAQRAALQGRLLSAQGLLSLIDNDARRAATMARVSLVARYQGQPGFAHHLLIDAERTFSRSPYAADPVVASELMRAAVESDGEVFQALKRSATADRELSGNASVEYARSVVAGNLAWVGDMQAAQQVAATITDPQLRDTAESGLQEIGRLLDMEEATATAAGPAR
ncbi:MAG: hypothetical protein KDI88_08070 [Gammaproteobacteria bacterium]|nr:hypothetical protein [Gammaproteobacteria bacterium]